MIIREATVADIPVMTQLRAESIRALCQPDHNDDEAGIARWIGDPDKFSGLLGRDGMMLIVIEIDEKMAGLGGMNGDRILLNYVHPAFRFQGISKAVMQSLESRMVAAGLLVGHLDSTLTAVPFYQSLGWVKAGPADPETGQPMVKDLL